MSDDGSVTARNEPHGEPELPGRVLWERDAIRPLLDHLTRIRDEMLEIERSAMPTLQDLPSDRRVSARNLLHYLALRRHDIRELQEQLVPCGLSSLGRCEGFVMANLEAVLRLLRVAAAVDVEPLPPECVPVDFSQGRRLLQQNTHRLFAAGGDDDPAIMVTMPSQAADDFRLVRDLLDAGMNVMRINCAHDDQTAWLKMIDNLRNAESESGRSCRVAMDLAGPKIRTGPIEPGPRVVSWKPRRDEFRRVVSNVRIRIASNAAEPCPVDCDVLLVADGDWWKRVASGDTLRFCDAAGRKRTLRVVHADSRGISAESGQSACVTPETEVRCVPAKSDRSKKTRIVGRFAAIPARENYLVLHQGDRLVVTDASTPGRPAQYDDHHQLTAVARIGCTLPEVLADVHPGDRILLDDGKIAGVVEQATQEQLVVEITRARVGGQRLRADKGMNFPDSVLHSPALTAKDVEDLAFVAQHADIVSYSFVRHADDLRLLQQELARLGHTDLAVILKIENRQAFDNLPVLLLEAMRSSPAVGVMIARGDLAVECGWERLVEVQEEILWICEAAHVPVVWATQVLEGLARNGLPTRAEVTDAGMGARAECVMLNKGPNIVATVQTLHDILLRMQEHQVKKRSTFRRLQMADRLFPR